MGFQDRLELLAGLGPVRHFYHQVDYWAWRVGGAGRTPFRAKAELLAGEVTDTRRTFVETGTYRGDMLARLRGDFDRLYSIERDSVLYRAAVHRFLNAPHVTVYQGDSARALGRVLAEVTGPCVVWLDAHPISGEPGEVPLLSELRTLLEHRGGGHRVAIDDIRLFSGEAGWPSLAEIVGLLHRSGRVAHLSMRDDMMTFTVTEGNSPTAGDE
ncbi:MAG: hypothetical protein M0Z47_07705 [Actinomycetota bacterium]|nr:hypothetical protein [Actinomycetota bacterium]